MLLDRRQFLLATTAALASTPLRAGDENGATMRLNGWLESRFDAWLATSPMKQSYLGLRTNLDKWDDLSEDHQAEDMHRAERDLADIRNFADASLTAEGKLSYQLYRYESQKRIDDYRWRHHAYVISQMDGWQQVIPTFLMNVHHVEMAEEADAYIARLNGVGALVDQIVDNLRDAEAAGVLMPRFVYDHAIRDCKNVLTGAPFDSGKPSSLLADINTKIDGVKADKAVKDRLKRRAATALAEGFKPAYLSLIALAEEQQARARTGDGVWELPNGEAFYANQLKYETTTAMTAKEIHAFGLSEVERIHGAMRDIMKKVGFTGELKGFFATLKTDPKFFYSDTAEGKAAYIADTKGLIDRMSARLGEMFLRIPKAKLEVRAVEPFREQSATSAFYESPGAYDGRPGTYFVNTFDMKAQPKWGIESVTYHETIPGHHLQVSTARELSELPRFRRFSDSYNAYLEGWALYCETLAKEMGFYQNPYNDFGRLSDELWRACRLVVDTAIHSAEHRWSRQKAIDYLRETTPNTDADIVNSVERYIVQPGQATSYKIGAARILALRAEAKIKLGTKFDIRAFHDTVLSHGALPMTMLADVVDAWVREQA